MLTLNDFKEQLVQRQENSEEALNDIRERFVQRQENLEEALNDLKKQFQQKQKCNKNKFIEINEHFEESFNELKGQLSQIQENYGKQLNNGIKKSQNDMAKLFITKQQLKQVLEAGKQGEFLRRSGGLFGGGFGIDDSQRETRGSGDNSTTYYKGIWLKDWKRAIDAIPK